MAKPVNVVRAYIDPYTGIVYADEGRTRDLTPIGFVISSGTNIGGGLLHASLVGLDADDHQQYVLVDASRPFTDIPSTTASGSPTDPTDLVTKAYVDALTVSGVAGVATLNGVTGIVTLAGAGSVAVSSGTNPITVSGSDEIGKIFKVSSLPLSPDEGDVVFLIPDKQFLGYTGTEWIILG